MQDKSLEPNHSYFILVDDCYEDMEKHNQMKGQFSALFDDGRSSRKFRLLFCKFCNNNLNLLMYVVKINDGYFFFLSVFHFPPFCPSK